MGSAASTARVRSSCLAEYTDVCMYVMYIQIYVHIYTHMYVCIPRHIHRHIYIYIYIYIYMYIYTYIRILIQISRYTDICTYIHIQARVRTSSKERLMNLAEQKTA